MPGFISGLSVLSHWSIFAVDWPRDCHIEWSKSELENQISYNITCMWITQKKYRWAYLQSRNRVRDVENKLIHYYV